MPHTSIIIMTYHLNFLFNNQSHKTQNGYYLNHDSLMAVNKEAKKRLSFYFIAEQTPQKLVQADYDSYKQLRRKEHYKYLPLDIFVVGALAWRTLFYQPRLVAPSASVKLIGFAGRALGFVALTSAYFSIVSKTKEQSIVNSQLVKELANKYNFGVYDFGLARKEATLVRLLEMLRW